MSIKKIKAAATVTCRDFLKESTLVTGAAIAPPIVVPEKVFDTDVPSKRITMGCIGTGG